MIVERTYCVKVKSLHVNQPPGSKEVDTVGIIILSNPAEISYKHGTYDMLKIALSYTF